MIIITLYTPVETWPTLIKKLYDYYNMTYTLMKHYTVIIEWSTRRWKHYTVIIAWLTRWWKHYTLIIAWPTHWWKHYTVIIAWHCHWWKYYTPIETWPTLMKTYSHSYNITIIKWPTHWWKHTVIVTCSTHIKLLSSHHDHHPCDNTKNISILISTQIQSVCTYSHAFSCT